MGNFLNRGKPKSRVADTLSPPPAQESGSYVPPEIISEDAKALERMRNALKNDVETFILNNLLMSVQFFENFERDKSVAFTPTVADVDRNRRLAPHERKCISPDKLHELVAQRVMFRPRCGSQKHCYQTLTNQRLYVVPQNIELCESLEDSHYSSVDEPNYHLAIENATNTGYLKLRSDENAQRKCENIYEKIDDINKTLYVDSKSNEETLIYSEGQSINETSSCETDTYEINPQRKKNPRPQSDGSIYDISNIKAESEEQSSSAIYKSPSVDILKNNKYKGVKEIRLAENKNNKKGSDNSGYKSASRGSDTYEYKSSSRMSDSSGYKSSSRGSSTSGYKLALRVSDSSGYNSSSRTSNSSGYKSSSTIYSISDVSISSSNYGYTTIQNLTTPRNLNGFRLGCIPANSSEIPYECFETITARAYGMKQIKGKEDLFETKCYLKSDTYMYNFVDLFVDRLSEALGYEKEIVETAKKCGPKIYCDILTKELPYTKKIRNEIIPAIKCGMWPKQAEEWVERYREPKLDIKSKSSYRWPTEDMVQEIKNMGCHLIPVGHMPRRGDDKNRVMEWQIVFPEAEQYMEKFLRHAHIRCYLFAMAVYKSFLEPLDAELGLLSSHIRTLLFWQYEKYYTAWPEDQQGKIFKLFLERIYDNLQHRKLKDYFIRHQNLIESMPDKFIYAVQEKIFYIKENLVMHMIITLRNLQYMDEDSFYPVFDYKKLYEIMTNEDLLHLANPKLVVNGTQNSMGKSNTHIVHEPKNDETAIDMMSKLETSNVVQNYYIQVRKHIEAKKATNKLAAQMMRSASVESIDVKKHLKRGTHPIQRLLLLELFIPHFIEMARKSITFCATEQAEMYLKHAERLTILFQEERMDETDGQEFLYNIKRLQEEAAQNTLVKSTQSQTSSKTDMTFTLTSKKEKKEESPQVTVRGRIPLSNDTVSPLEIDTYSVKVDVHKEPQYMKNIKIAIPKESTESHTSGQSNVRFTLAPKKEKKESPQVIVREKIPLPNDRVSHVENDKPNVMITKVDVHMEPQYMKNRMATKITIPQKQDSQEESSDEETRL